MRGKIVSVYGSISKFAEAMKWSYSKANRIANKTQEPTAKQIDQMSRAFGVETSSEFRNIFF